MRLNLNWVVEINVIISQSCESESRCEKKARVVHNALGERDVEHPNARARWVESLRLM